ncbi:hypothetical protein CANARDRAFT_183356, partial [[Candida] arabinofermentans NRRL YB-2248]
ISRNCAVFGRWDGSIQCAALNQKNMLVASVKEIYHKNEPDRRAYVTCVEVNNGPSAKEGKIGSVTGDDKGYIYCWDLKKAELVMEIKVSMQAILFCSSDFKDVIICYDKSGCIWIIRNVFNMFDNTPEIELLVEFKDTNTPITIGRLEAIPIKMMVDYGGKNVVMVNNHKVEVFSYGKDTKDKQFQRVYTIDLPAPGTTTDLIFKSTFEQNDTWMTSQDELAVGGNGLMLALLMKSGDVTVLNIRSMEHNLKPVLKFTPGLVHNDDIYHRMISVQMNQDIPIICEIAINSMVLVVGSYNGMMEMYDPYTGELLRKISDRTNKNLKMELSHRLVPISKILLDERTCSGVVIFDSAVQHFHFGDFYKELELNKKKRRNLGRLVREGKNLEIKNSLQDYEYELQEEEKKLAMLNKYNGELSDSEEELEMALAMSVSINSETRGSR